MTSHGKEMAMLAETERANREAEHTRKIQAILNPIATVTSAIVRGVGSYAGAKKAVSHADRLQLQYRPGYFTGGHR